MTFTVISDLNGESPQFTLTCTSTGGPATTVTWTRDSETVSGGMTVLDDPVTAQYTHTLTVTGRLGGQYQCTVSNNKPSEDAANFTVQGTCTHTSCTATETPVLASLTVQYMDSDGLCYLLQCTCIMYVNIFANCDIVDI